MWKFEDYTDEDAGRTVDGDSVFAVVVLHGIAFRSTFSSSDYPNRRTAIEAAWTCFEEIAQSRSDDHVVLYDKTAYTNRHHLANSASVVRETNTGGQEPDWKTARRWREASYR